MNKWIMTLLLATCCITMPIFATIPTTRFLQSEEAVQQATYGHIDAKGLKSLMDSQTPFILLDARGKKWHDNNAIPGAILLSYDSEEAKFEEIIPSKDTLVVVYCFSFTCPLSTLLAQKLVELGYTNILEYPAGLKEWRDVANYPIMPIEE